MDLGLCNRWNTNLHLKVNKHISENVKPLSLAIKTLYCFFFSGNLLVVAFVSYFGAKLHRPRLIAIGCLIMAVGSYLIALPHFFQGLSVHNSFYLLIIQH